MYFVFTVCYRYNPVGAYEFNVAGHTQNVNGFIPGWML